MPALPLKRRRPNLLLLTAGVMLVVGVWLFREPLRQWISERATLSNDAPPPELVRDMIEQATDPRAALLSAWHSGKIVHRQVAVREVSHLIQTSDELPTELETLLLSAALDPDMNVREIALGTLSHRDHPALPALAAAQLEDCDSQVRYLGLTYLRKADVSVALPLAASLLDDPDLRVVGMSLKVMESASGEAFGSKLSDTVQIENKQTGLKEYQESGISKTAAAVVQAKAWWTEHQDGFPPVDLTVPEAAFSVGRRRPVRDFELRTLEGNKVRLSDYRGKVVLLNFWTTWCTACVGEMPALNALQNQNQADLIILGISLDYIPDSHGHIGGHAAVEDQARNDGHHDDHEPTEAALKRVRDKIVRTVKAREVTYPILLDEENEVGGQFNGGELPTTVIIDADGFVRRRFIGTRTLPVFESMIREAATP